MVWANAPVANANAEIDTAIIRKRIRHSRLLPHDRTDNVNPRSRWCRHMGCAPAAPRQLVTRDPRVNSFAGRVRWTRAVGLLLSYVQAAHDLSRLRDGKTGKGSAMYGPLNDPHFVLLVLSCAAVITIGSLVTALNRTPRVEFARLQNEVEQLSKLQNEVEQLSEKIKALEAAEERRFLMELNKRKRNGAEPLGSIPSVTTATEAPPLVTDAGTTDLAALARPRRR